MNKGPVWIAILDTDETMVGYPSWRGHSPDIPVMQRGVTDWQNLRIYCEETQERIKSLALRFPQWGQFNAPLNRGAYGYFEEHVSNLRGKFLGIPRGVTPSLQYGVRSLCICWPEEGYGIKILRITANGELEHRRQTKWLPCMIGSQDVDVAVLRASR